MKFSGCSLVLEVVMKNHLHTKEGFEKVGNGYRINNLASCCFNSGSSKIDIIYHSKQKK